MQETPTAPVEPLEGTPQTSPAPEAAPQAQPEPATAPETTPEAEAGAEAPWAGVKEREGLREHVQPLLEDAERAGYDKRTGELVDYGHQQSQQRIQQLNDMKAGVGRMTKGVDVLTKAMRESGVDADAVEEWANSHTGTLNALKAEWNQPNGEYPSFWRVYGVKQVMISLADAAGEMDVQPFIKRLDAYSQGYPDNSLFSDFVKQASTKVVKDAEEKGYQRGLTENRDAAAERERLEGRQGQGANLAPGSPAGGRTDNELLLDKNTPIEKLEEIRARQRAAGG